MYVRAFRLTDGLSLPDKKRTQLQLLTKALWDPGESFNSDRRPDGDFAHSQIPHCQAPISTPDVSFGEFQSSPTLSLL